MDAQAGAASAGSGARSPRRRLQAVLGLVLLCGALYAGVEVAAAGRGGSTNEPGAPRREAATHARSLADAEGSMVGATTVAGFQPLSLGTNGFDPAHLAVRSSGSVWVSHLRSLPIGCGPGGPTCEDRHSVTRVAGLGSGGGDFPLDGGDPGPFASVSGGSGHAGVVADTTAAPGLGIGPDGEVWFLRSEGLGRVTPTLATVRPGPGDAGDLVAGPDGNVWFVTYGTDLVGWVDPATGVGATFAPGLDSPGAIVVGPDDNLWMTSRGNDRIVRMTTAGVPTVFEPAGVDGPEDIVAGPDGNLWFSSRGNDRIGRITPTGAVTLFADPAGMLDAPHGLAWGPGGFLYATSSGNNRLAVIDATGAMLTVPLPAYKSGGTPSAIAATDSELFYLSSEGVLRVVGSPLPSEPRWVETELRGFVPYVRWQKPATAAEAVTSYRLYRDGALIETRAVDDLIRGYRDVDAEPGETHVYEVAPVTTGGEGPRASVELTTPSTGSITVVTDTQPGRLAADVGFEGCGPMPQWCGSFALDDDDDPTLADRRVAPGLAPGTYTITQTDLPAGYALDQISCVGGGTTVDLAQREVVVELGSAVTDVVCTFRQAAESFLEAVVEGRHRYSTGTLAGSISGDVAFEGCLSANNACASFALDDDDDPTVPDRAWATGVAPGTYTITLTDLPPGTAFGGFSGDCGTTDVAARRATIVVSGPGDRHSCTFRVVANTLDVSVYSEAAFSGRTDFERCGPDPGACESFSVQDEGSHSLTELAPGTHSVTIDVPAGTYLEAVDQCPNGSVIDLPGGRVSIQLTSTTYASCQFRLAVSSVTISLEAKPKGTRADVGFEGCRVGDACATFVLDDDDDLRTPSGDDTHLAQHVSRRLGAGTYTVTLTELPPGLELDAIDCSGDGATVDLGARRVTLALAEIHEVSCNFRVGGSSVAGVLEGPDEPVGFRACGPTPAMCVDYLVDDDGPSLAYDDRRGEAGLAPGEYSFTLTDLPPQATLDSIVCTGDGTTVDLGARRATIDLTTQRVWCTFNVSG